MMTLRENAMAIYNHQQPDYYFDLMDAIQLVPDPVLMAGMFPQDGREYKDPWGTAYIYKPGAPGPHPHVTAENAVIKDIEHWKDSVVVPPTRGLDWSAAKKVADETDRKEKFVGVLFGGGLFERSHHLMGMENALCSYLEYPEEMAELLRVIADYKIDYIHEMGKQIRPDIIFYHDDWGSKQNVFLPPRVWREIIKPLQKEIADAIHEEGMIYMHHADCICQPLVTDMVEIGIDIWQGVIAQNDKVVAICSALEVDCMGQVNADTRGTTVFSGVGGQLDFMRGAEQSKGGKPIIALPSTAKHGEVSRIVACLGAGTPVTTTRQDVHWVVTEYGAVDLFGMPIKERAKALISIAHPKFRERLEKDWEAYCRNAGMLYL